MVSLFKRVFRAKKVWIVLAITILSLFGVSYFTPTTGNGGEDQGSSIQPTSSVQLRAWDYVRKHLEFSVPYGTLLREYPTASTAWLNDAYLASMSMARMFPQDARGIAVALSSLNFTDSRWSALACDQEHFQGLFGLGPTPASWPSQSGVQVKAWLRNQTLFLPDFNRYADLLALTVIDEQCSGNHVKALELFGQLKGMFHGIGFVDAVYEQRSVYETFKLALALIAAQKVGDQDFADKLTGLLTKQQYSLTNVDGHQYGFITDYREIGIASDDQIPTNAEPTLLSLIALSPSTPLKPANGVQVGVFYYGWYSDGYHGYHWANNNCTALAPMPVVYSSYDALTEHPLIGGPPNGTGYYDSRDRNLVDAQLREMQKVGIEFLLFSWWGSDNTATNDNFTDHSAKVLFDELGKFPGMKAAILVENYPTKLVNGGKKLLLYDNATLENYPNTIPSVFSYVNRTFVSGYPGQ